MQNFTRKFLCTCKTISEFTLPFSCTIGAMILVDPTPRSLPWAILCSICVIFYIFQPLAIVFSWRRACKSYLTLHGIELPRWHFRPLLAVIAFALSLIGCITVLHYYAQCLAIPLISIALICTVIFETYHSITTILCKLHLIHPHVPSFSYSGRIITKINPITGQKINMLDMESTKE